MKTVLKLSNDFRKVAGYKINCLKKEEQIGHSQGRGGGGIWEK